jgi:hypothetical protein
MNLSNNIGVEVYRRNSGPIFSKGWIAVTGRYATQRFNENRIMRITESVADVDA